MVDFIKLEEFNIPTNTFTFPYNPQSLDITGASTQALTPIPYSDLAISISNGTLQPRICTLQGHFSGENKNTQFDDLTKILYKPILKKFYFNPTRFMFFVTGDAIPTYNANRSAFTGYNLVLTSVYHNMVSDTLKTASYNGSWTGGTQTNAGNKIGVIESFEVTMSGSSASGKILDIATTSRSGLRITLPAYSDGQVLTMNFIQQVESAGLFVTKHWYTKINGVQIGRDVADTKTQLGLYLDVDTQIDTLVISGDATYSSIEFKFRDTYLAI